jgi:hypothetical protein
MEAEAVVAGLDDIAIMGKTVEWGGSHLASPNTPAHSLKLRLVVMTQVRS